MLNVDVAEKQHCNILPKKLRALQSEYLSKKILT